jgi:hypothetical protein
MRVMQEKYEDMLSIKETEFKH